MEKVYRRIIFASRSPICPCIFANNPGSVSSRRTISTTKCLQAAKITKPTKPPSQKSQRQPLEYKTPTRKPPPSSQIPPPVPRPNPLRYRTIPIIFGSITLFALSGYCTYLYVILTREPSSEVGTTASNQEDVSIRYDFIASTFDDHVSFTERVMGINSLRKKLASQAHGDVLEVSIGTGRNLEFYDWDFKGFNGVGKVGPRGDIKKGKVRSFTAVDKSAEMLEIAHRKFTTMFPGILGLRWVVGDAAESGIIPGPPRNANERSGSLEGKKYDTIIQTMGLCSVRDPVALLKNLGNCVQEDDGRIMLLEHGRGNWQWLNGVLDRFAEGHAKQFGCWWNRDFQSVIEECGLEVVSVERPKWWHGGTTWWIELKKPKSSTGGIEMAKAVKETKKGWW